MDNLHPNFIRLEMALQHKEPDRIPFVEAGISYDIMSKFLGKEVKSSDLASQVEFWIKAGYDYIPLTVGMLQPGKVTEDSAISKVIKNNITKEDKTEEAWNLEKRAFIFDEADLERFPWEEAANIDYSKFYEVQKYLPDGMKIIALSGKVFTLSWLLMGYENFCMNLILNPAFVKRLIDKVQEIQYAGIQKVITIPNVAAVWGVDDIAFGTGTMISPKDLREYFFPWYKKVGKLCHDHGVYLFYHTDGLIWDVMDDLIDTGIDALHPIDPTCMDIEEVKKRVGDKLCIIGNISNELLMNGSPEEIIELTKKRIKNLGPGGRYCMGSGNSVPDWAKIENYKAMIDTTLKYGTYPINI